ncbi:MAG: DUF3048 domain-containing protein [Lachnospiraceae bacterium]|nr:DUF3048 domain-containing protein [Lachnospiraceae bacterium]
MKKMRVLLMLALAGTLVLGGCGGTGDTNEVLSPDDIVHTVTPGTEESESPDVTPSTEADTSKDNVVSEEPPTEGMVRSFLTGLWIEEADSETRPIAVMFPTDKGSQPQYNIGAAGVLYEAMEEGGMSRQMGVIEGWQDMEKIGNIRSGRDYYGYWAMEWDAFFVHWGGPFYLVELVERDEFENLTGSTIGTADVGAPATGNQAFWRSDPENPNIHNGYTDGTSLKKNMNKLDYQLEHRDDYYVKDHFNFASELNTLEDAPGVRDAEKIDLSKVFTTTRTSLQYNEEEGVYYKFLYGNAQVDEVTGEQLTFTNVIVQNTRWEYRPDNKYLKFHVVDNTMDGYYFTQGKCIPITWEKESDYAPTRYYDKDGNEIELNPGKTFIAIAQEGRNVIFD